MSECKSFHIGLHAGQERRDARRPTVESLTAETNRLLMVVVQDRDRMSAVRVGELPKYSGESACSARDCLHGDIENDPFRHS